MCLFLLCLEHDTINNNNNTQHENHTRSVAAMTKDRMERHSFRGVEAVVWLGTLPAPTPTHSRMCKPAAGRPLVRHSAAGAALKKQHHDNFVRALTSFPSLSRHPVYGVNKQWNLSQRSDVELPKSVTNHGWHLRQRISVAIQRGNAACINETLQANCA